MMGKEQGLGRRKGKESGLEIMIEEWEGGWGRKDLEVGGKGGSKD